MSTARVRAAHKAQIDKWLASLPPDQRKRMRVKARAALTAVGARYQRDLPPEPEPEEPGDKWIEPTPEKS